MKFPRTYTHTEKTAAITLTLEVGAAVASRQVGIPSGTLSCWAHKARLGVEGYALPTATQATAEGDPSPSEVPQEEAPASSDTSGSGPSKMARVYTPSEKARALELAAKIGVTAASKELGISRYSLYDWRRRVERAARGEGDSPTSGPDPADIEAQRDREILDL